MLEQTANCYSNCLWACCQNKALYQVQTPTLLNAALLYPYCNQSSLSTDPLESEQLSLTATFTKSCYDPHTNSVFTDSCKQMLLLAATDT